MKTCLVCLLLLLTPQVNAQIVFEPEGPLKKKEKSDADKIRLGLSTQLILYRVYFPNKILVSLNVYRKNLALNLGPALYINPLNNSTSPNMTFKRYGYNLALRYIFPQNKGIAKAFVPLEFSHTINLRGQASYYDHMTATSGPGNLPNPGYSFNLNTKSRTNDFAVKTGFGLYIWLQKHFNVELQVLLGTNFIRGKTDYFNTDNGHLLDTENIVVGEEESPVLLEFSIGFGYRF